MTCASGSLALQLNPTSCRRKCWARPWTVVITAVLMTFPVLRIGARWHRWLQRCALLQKASGVRALTALFLETLTVCIEKVTEPFIVIREWL